LNNVHIKPPNLSVRNEQFVSGPLKVDETRLFVTNFPYNISE
jgi:multiple RNA-binding domain-containing protein 1